MNKAMLFLISSLVVLGLASPLTAQSSTRRQSTNADVVITVNVPGAKVYFNRNLVPGPFPFTLKAAPGAYSITATAPGYQDFSTSFELTSSGITVNVVLQGAMASVNFSSNAPGAMLTLGSQSVPLPTTINLAPGTYSVTASAPGYNSLTTSFTAKGSMNLPLILTSQAYGVTITSSTPGAVLVMGKTITKLPTTMNLAGGSYTLTVSAPDYESFTTNLQVTGPLTLPIDLTPLSARIKSEGVTVFIDGVQQPDGIFDVKPGRHRVRLMLGNRTLPEKDFIFKAKITYDIFLMLDFTIGESK